VTLAANDKNGTCFTFIAINEIAAALYKKAKAPTTPPSRSGPSWTAEF
jgi:hypothetical protein